MRVLVSKTILLLTLPLALLATAVTLAGDAVAVAIGRVRRLGARQAAPATPRDASRASIIILNWNGRDLLARGLPSVIEAVRRAGGEHEIIVVDNGSTDGSVAFLRDAFPVVSVMALERNLGFGAGNNLGVRAARNDIVVLLNNDMVVDPGFLPPLLRPFSDERVFAVSSQIFMDDAQSQRVETGQTRAAIRRGRLQAWHAVVSQSDDAPRPCLWAGGGSGAYDRRRFLELGGFDELYAPFYVEDVDLSYRAWKRGWTVLLAPQSIVYHRHRASTARLGADYIERAFAKNCRLFVWHNITDLAWTLAGLLCIPSDLAAALRMGEANDAQAILWALRQWPAALRRRWAARASVRAEAMAPSPSDREVFRTGCSRYWFRERFAPPSPVPESGRKKILVLCPYLPVPPAHGGAVRMLNLIKNLSLNNDVDVLSFIDREDERQYAPDLEPHCRRLRLVLRRPPFGRYDPLRDRSWLIEEFDTPEMGQALLEMLDDEDYHVLQIEYTQMAQYHPGARRMQTSLDEVDLTFRSFYRQKIAGRRPPPMQAVIDYLKLVRFEVESCRRVDYVLAMSDDDAACLRDYAPEKRRAIVTVANGVDTGYYTPPDAWPGGSELLFMGSHRHTPNQEGIRYFLREVFPIIQSDMPQARLTVVGDGPWASMLEIKDNPAVTATGFVADTRPHFARCAVSVAPILSGAGTRIKILDSLAAGIPIVATTIGAEGIAARHGEEILIADTPAEFAAAVLRLLHDPALAEKLRRNGRRLAEQTYDWRAIAARLEQIYERGRKV